MVTQLLIQKLVQLFLVMFLGFILVKCRVVKSEESKVLSKVVLYILVPCVILNAFDLELTPQISRGLYLSFGTSLFLHLLYLVLDRVFLKLGKGSAVERASVMYSNAANLIIPIVSYILGGEWVIYTAGFLIIQLIFIWSHGVGLFSDDAGFQWKKILLNVNMISIAVGFVMLFMNLHLPAFLSQVTGSLGGMMGDVGMLVCGMLLASVDFSKIIRNKRLYLICAIRLLVYPVITLLVVKAIGHFVTVENSGEILLIVFLGTITPAATMVTQFAQVHNKDVEYCTAINVVSTLLCIITMPIFVALYTM